LLQFGRRLRTARNRLGLSQHELASPDLSKGFVSLLETARSYPSVETIIALARRTHTSVASLLLDPADLRLETARNLLHLAWVMDMTRHSADVPQLVDSAELLLPDMPAELRVQAKLVRARAAMATGAMDDAAGLADEAIVLVREQHLDDALGRALTVRGIVDERRGAYPAAAATLEDALDAMRRSKSVDTEEGVWAYLSLGVARWRMNQNDEAERAYREALALKASAELPRMQGRALTGLGLLAWTRGQLDQAVELFSQAYAVFQGIEDLAEMGRVLNNLGLVRREQGLHDEALAVLTTALHIREREGDARGRSATLDEIARVLLTLGRADEAADAARRAVADAQTAGDRARETVARVTLARVLRAQDQPEAAIGLLRAAVATLRDLGMTREVASASAELGLMLKDAGQPDEAAEHLANALTLRAGGPSLPRWDEGAEPQGSTP
jgi:tetratricopeptide (TPR) repeat protein